MPLSRFRPFVFFIFVLSSGEEEEEASDGGSDRTKETKGGKTFFAVSHLLRRHRGRFNLS